MHVKCSNDSKKACMARSPKIINWSLNCMMILLKSYLNYLLVLTFIHKITSWLYTNNMQNIINQFGGEATKYDLLTYVGTPCCVVYKYYLAHTVKKIGKCTGNKVAIYFPFWYPPILKREIFLYSGQEFFFKSKCEQCHKKNLNSNYVYWCIITRNGYLCWILSHPFFYRPAFLWVRTSVFAIKGWTLYPLHQLITCYILVTGQNTNFRNVTGIFRFFSIEKKHFRLFCLGRNTSVCL